MAAQHPHSPLAVAQWLSAIDGATDEAELAEILANARAGGGLNSFDWEQLSGTAFERQLVMIAERPLPETERLLQLVALAESLGETPAAEPLGLVLELAFDLGQGAALLPMIAMATPHRERLPALADTLKLLWHRVIATATLAELPHVVAAANAFAEPAFAELAEARLHAASVA